MISGTQTPTLVLTFSIRDFMMIKSVLVSESAQYQPQPQQIYSIEGLRSFRDGTVIFVNRDPTFDEAWIARSRNFRIRVIRL